MVTQNIAVDGAVELLGDWFDPQGAADLVDLAPAPATASSVY